MENLLMKKRVGSTLTDKRGNLASPRSCIPDTYVTGAPTSCSGLPRAQAGLYVPVSRQQQGTT